jgi:hypothetical protein
MDLRKSLPQQTASRPHCCNKLGSTEPQPLRPVKRSEQSLFKLIWHRLRFRRHKELIGPSEAALEQLKAHPFAIRTSQGKALGHGLADIR